MARRIIRGKQNPGDAPTRMQRPTREESGGLFGLGKKQVPYDTPEFLESVRQYNEWSQASQAYRQAQQNNRLVGQRTRLMNDRTPWRLPQRSHQGYCCQSRRWYVSSSSKPCSPTRQRYCPLCIGSRNGHYWPCRCSILGDYYDQVADGLSTDPLSVLGRSISNLGVGGGVGTDPLASARLKVQEAQQQLGSDAVLAAVVEDQLVGQAQAEKVFDQKVSALVDARAAELQGTPIQKSDGSLAPMGYETAIRLAQNEHPEDCSPPTRVLEGRRSADGRTRTPI